MLEELEEKYGFDVDTLNSTEKDLFFKMLEDVQKSQISIEKLREYYVAMRDSIERELVNEPTFIRLFLFKVENPKLIKLQARLHNYMLLESFLISPERAKQQLENALGNLAKSVGANKI